MNQWFDGLATYLKARGHKVVARTNSTPQPVCVMVRYGGEAFTDRGPKHRALVDVVAAWESDKDVDMKVAAETQIVGESLWLYGQCLPQTSGVPALLRPAGQNSGVIISTIEIVQV